MLLLSYILFGLCTSIAANAITPKADFKAQVINGLAEAGVVVTENCEFQVDKERFENSRVITECQVEVYVEKLLAEIWPHHYYVEGLVTKLEQLEGSEQTLNELTSELVMFSTIVLTNELQLVSNFPRWVAEEKWSTLYNNECLAENESAQFEKMTNDTDLECGYGELELDGEAICKSLDKFENALNTIKECQEKKSTCLTEPNAKALIVQGLEEFEALYTETPDSFDSEKERYTICLVYALGLIAADNDNAARNLARCVFDNLNDNLVPVPDSADEKSENTDSVQDENGSPDSAEEAGSPDSVKEENN